MNKINKGGRPRLQDPKDVKNIRVGLSFSQNEIDLINAFIEEHNITVNQKSVFFSNIILDSIKGNKIKVVNFIEPKSLMNINKIGVNLNQLIKKMHSLDGLSEADTNKIKHIIDKIYNTYFSK